MLANSDIINSQAEWLERRPEHERQDHITKWGKRGKSTSGAPDNPGRDGHFHGGSGVWFFKCSETN